MVGEIDLEGVKEMLIEEMRSVLLEIEKNLLEVYAEAVKTMFGYINDASEGDADPEILANLPKVKWALERALRGKMPINVFVEILVEHVPKLGFLLVARSYVEVVPWEGTSNGVHFEFSTTVPEIRFLN